MFNSVNNPFGKRIESALSTSQDKKQNQQQQKEEDEKRLLEEEDADEVKIGGRPMLNEEQILYLTREYIAKLKSEHSDNPKTIEKLDKFLSKFDVKNFMKRNPDMTTSDFYMVMYNETEKLIN